jgi:hypothetical protein
MRNLADTSIAPNGGFRGFGPLGLVGSTGADADYTFQLFISQIIGVISIVAIIWFIFLLLTGGISYMSAGGDKGAVEAARKKITNGIIGLVITLFGIFLVNLLGQFFGIQDILNLPGMLSVITGGP